MTQNANAHLTVKGTGAQRIQGGILEATGQVQGTASLVVAFPSPEATGTESTLVAPWSTESSASAVQVPP